MKRIMLLLTALIVLSGCSKNEVVEESVTYLSESIISGEPTLPTEPESFTAPTVNYSDLPTVKEEQEPISGNLFESEVDIEVIEETEEKPFEFNEEEYNNVSAELLELSKSVDWPYRNIEPENYSFVDSDELPELEFFDKDVYGNYIVPEEYFEREEYFNQSLGFDGPIGYICCYEEINMIDPWSVLVNPIPENVKKYSYKFDYIDTTTLKKQIFKK